MTKYTFLLPAFKTDYLEKTLCSIKHQTYNNYTVVVSDDCSPFPVHEIFKRVCGNDIRFVYRRNEENMGGKNLVSHWNQLVDMCDTEYMILASDDDVYDSSFLEEIDRLVRKYPRVNLLRSRVQLIDHNDNVLEEDSISEEIENQSLFLYNQIATHRIVCIANYVFKTSALRSAGGFENFPLAWGSDEATVLKLCVAGVAITRDILFSFRKSTVNISNQYSRDVVAKKLQANMAYLLFFDRYAKRISCSDTLLEKGRIEEYVRVARKNIVSSIIAHSWTIDLKKISSHLCYLHKIGAFPFKIDYIHCLSSILYKRIHSS